MAASAIGNAKHERFACWSPAGNDLTIEYSVELFDSIRATAVEGLNRFKHGGIEIGGVLFGTRDENRIRIASSRVLQNDYALGPGFVLSEHDEADLTRLIQTVRTDPQLRGFEAVGWYHSHTRSRVFLSAQDIALHQRHFPKSWQIAMVLCPTQLGPAEAGFFLRETDGSLRTEASRETFTLSPIQPQESPKEVEPIRAVTAGPEPSVIEAPRSIIVAETSSAPRRWKPGWPWLFASLVLAALAVSTFFGVFHISEPSEIDQAKLDLTAVDRNGEITIEWNRDAEAVLASQKASITISDGDKQVNTALGPEMLHNGRLVYYRASSDIEIRMVLYREKGSETTELTRLIGLSPIPRPAEIIKAKPAPLPPQVRSRILREESVKSSEAAPVTPPKQENIFEPPIPKITNAEPKDVAPVVAPLPAASPKPLEPPSSPTREPAKRQASYVGPTTGRVIWTGALGPNSTLQIDGNDASFGSLTGAFPDAPVTIAAHPASLSRGAMYVYVEKPVETNELPGPANGWLRTVYQRDAKRAGDITVKENPSVLNQRKMVLQSGNRNISAIVIDWTVSQTDR